MSFRSLNPIHIGAGDGSRISRQRTGGSVVEECERGVERIQIPQTGSGPSKERHHRHDDDVDLSLCQEKKTPNFFTKKEQPTVVLGFRNQINLWEADQVAVALTTMCLETVPDPLE